jgi:hypothetical protein
MILTGKSRLIVPCPDARDAVREVAILEKIRLCVMQAREEKEPAAKSSRSSRDAEDRCGA